MKRILKYAIIGLAICLISFFTFERVFLVALVKKAVQDTLGVEIQMNRVILRPLDASVTIKGLKIFNPPEFEDQILASVPLFVMDFKRDTFTEKGVFFNSIVIHIEEINVVKNKDSAINFSKIRALAPKELPKEKAKKAKKDKPFGVDNFCLQLEKVNYIDYTKDENMRRAIELNLKEEYRNLKDVSSIAKVIAYKIFFNGRISNIGVNIGKIKKDLVKLAEENKNLADDLTKAVQETVEAVKKTTEEVKESIQDLKVVIKEKVEEVKDTIEEKVNGGKQ